MTSDCVVVVTGASSGLGFELARCLVENEYDVIFACRNKEKANRAIDKIARLHPTARATFITLDLSSLESVRQFVKDFQETGKKLNVLVNNAGVLCNFTDTKKINCAETCFELTMGTNHLGPFLLTNLLLGDLKKCAAEEGEARIVNVTSHVHDPATTRNQAGLEMMDLDDIFLEKEGSFSGIQAYKNSKLANIMFTYELSRRLQGTGVTANCVCPGFIPKTQLTRNLVGKNRVVYGPVMSGILQALKIACSAYDGSQAIYSLVCDDKYKGVTGKYFKNGEEQKSSDESLNEDNLKKLWDVSAGYVQLPGYDGMDAERVEAEKP